MRISDWSSDVCSSDLDFAAGDKFPEFIQHLVVPRIVELRHRNCRDDCTKASGFLLCVLLRQNAAGGRLMTMTYRNARWLLLPVSAMSLSACGITSVPTQDDAPTSNDRRIAVRGKDVTVREDAGGR